MARKVVFVQGEYYHLYNRGCGKEHIFRSPENYSYLLKHIEATAARMAISVIAYCLMPNHYHLVIRQDGASHVSSFMQSIFNKYTKAYNAYYSRSGTLFEGPFKSRHVDSEEYLLHLCRYVHRNPLDARMVTRLDDWPYSNYPEWIGKRNGSLVDLEFIKSRFSSAEEYREFVMNHAPSEKGATHFQS